MPRDELAPLNLPGCKLTSSGLQLSDALTYTEWDDIGTSLATLNGCLLWLVGDWIIYGQRRWADKYHKAKCATQYDYQTLRTAFYVANSISLLRRRNKLSRSHHREVAALDEPEQDKWLDLAEQHKLSRNELRASIRAGKVVREKDGGDGSTSKEVLHSPEVVRLRFQLWLAHSTREDALENRTTDWWREVDANYRPIAVFWLRNVAPKIGLDVKKVADIPL